MKKTLKTIAKGKGERAEQAKEMIRLNKQADANPKEIRKQLLKKLDKLCQKMMTEYEKEIWEYHKDVLKAEGYTKDDYIDMLGNTIGSSDEWTSVYYTLGMIDGVYNLLYKLDKIK